MKRYLPLLLIILFPYLIIFAVICIFTGFLMETIFQNNGLLLLFLLIFIYIIALICAIIVFIKIIIKKQNAQEILHINMVIKLIHIPAYIILFLMGMASLITIFTMGFGIAFFILDCLTIFLTGLIGLGGLIRSLIEKKISFKSVLFYGISQFIFCIDVISSIIIYRKVKKK